MDKPPALMPALITPFAADGEIDLDAHRHNVARLTAEGLAGFVIAGSTGEGPYLEPGERTTLIAAARHTATDAFLLCGINGETVRLARGQIREAARGGANGVLVITPTTLVRGRDANVEDFYTDVAAGAALPLYLYSVPRVTGYELPVESIIRLSRHPAIFGIKDSGGDPARVKRLRPEVEAAFDLYIGASRAVSDGVVAGARGAMTASANYAWNLLRAVLAAAGDVDRAAQSRLDALIGAIEPLGIAATKVAAKLVGLRSGRPRRPLRPLDPSQRSAVADALRSAGLATPPP